VTLPLDALHESFFLAVRQNTELPLGFRVPAQSRREIGWHRRLAWRDVKFDININLLAAGDFGFLAVCRADADHEPFTHHRNRAAVRVAVDGDTHRWFLVRSKLCNDVFRNLNTGRRLASKSSFEIEFRPCGLTDRRRAAARLLQLSFPSTRRRSPWRGHAPVRGPS
jgi:hypothetical protein